MESHLCRIGERSGTFRAGLNAAMSSVDRSSKGQWRARDYSVRTIEEAGERSNNLRLSMLSCVQGCDVMSALNFLASDRAALVVADTLGTFPATGRPGLFCTKVMPLPHLRMLIASVGVIDIATGWHAYVQGHLVVPGIAEASQYAPVFLRRIWKDRPPNGGRTVIYHIGIDGPGGRLRVYAFDSSNDFQCNEKPVPLCLLSPDTPGILPSEIKSTESLIQAVITQREHDLKRPPLERVGIGGEVIATTIFDGMISVKTVHRFDDYDESYREAIERAVEVSKSTS